MPKRKKGPSPSIHPSRRSESMSEHPRKGYARREVLPKRRAYEVCVERKKARRIIGKIDYLQERFVKARLLIEMIARRKLSGGDGKCRNGTTYTSRNSSLTLPMLPPNTSPSRLGNQHRHSRNNSDKDQDAHNDQNLAMILAHISPARALRPRELLLSPQPLLRSPARIWVDAALASRQRVAGAGRHGRDAEL